MSGREEIPMEQTTRRITRDEAVRLIREHRVVNREVLRVA